MRVLLIGDIIGRPGREVVRLLLPRFKVAHRIDFVVANGENAAGGTGITREKAEDLFRAGVHVITTGNHIWKHKTVLKYLDSEERLLRPANFSPRSPGRGWGVYRTDAGESVGVVNLQGRVFMAPSDCPFEEAERALEQIRPLAAVILVDFHAEATSEKQALGWFLDGSASVVAGTHTHVQTADEQILPQGTAYITDLGMTGPFDSIIGMEREPALSRFLDGMPRPMTPARDRLFLEGLVADIDASSGKARSVERIHLSVQPTPPGDDAAGGTP